jgi:RNA polymerase sigma-70 factor (ECF subfamily)
LRRSPTPIVALNRAVAVAMWRGPAEGLRLVDELRGELAAYHLWHATRADLLRRLGKRADAAKAYREALARVGSDPERRFLERRLGEVS